MNFIEKVDDSYRCHQVLYRPTFYDTYGSVYSIILQTKERKGKEMASGNDVISLI